MNTERLSAQEFQELIRHPEACIPGEMMGLGLGLVSSEGTVIVVWVNA